MGKILLQLFCLKGKGIRYDDEEVIKKEAKKK